MPRPSASTGGIGSLLGGLVILAGLVTVRSVCRWVTSGTSSSQPHVDPRSVEAGHELHELNPLVPLAAGIVVVLGVAISVGVVTWYQAIKIDRPLSLTSPPGLATPVPPPPPPAPRLEEVPGEQLRRLRAAEDQILNGTAWVDQSAGVARIPIDRAEDLLIQQGLPARTAQEASQYRDQADTAPSSASSGRVPERRVP